MIKERATQWTMGDIASLVSKERVESVALEFKRDLPGKNAAEKWNADRQLNDAAKKELTAIITGFANTRGGTLILGIEESDESPGRAVGTSAILQCTSLAERISQVLEQWSEPTLPSLEVFSILEENNSPEQKGFVVISVPGSRLAPHRNRIDGNIYARRDTRTVSLSMGELKADILDRIRSQNAVFQTLTEKQDRFQNSVIHAANASPLSHSYGMRVSGVPLSDLGISRVFDQLELATRWPIFIELIGRDTREMGSDAPWRAKRRIVRGVQFDNHMDSVDETAEIGNDGSYNHILVERITKEGESLYRYGWHLMFMVFNAMVAIERLRVIAAAQSSPFAFQVQIFSINGVQKFDLWNNFLAPGRPTVLPAVAPPLPMIELGNRESFQNSFTTIIQDVADFLDQPMHPLNVDFDRVWSKLGI